MEGRVAWDATGEDSGRANPTVTVLCTPSTTHQRCHSIAGANSRAWWPEPASSGDKDRKETRHAAQPRRFELWLSRRSARTARAEAVAQQAQLDPFRRRPAARSVSAAGVIGYARDRSRHPVSVPLCNSLRREQHAARERPRAFHRTTRRTSQPGRSLATASAGGELDPKGPERTPTLQRLPLDAVTACRSVTRMGAP